MPRLKPVLPAPAAALTVPAEALVNDGVDRYVLVEEANAVAKSEYRKRSVTVLRQTPEWVEIQSADLLPGDRVVTQGSPQLGGLFVPGPATMPAPRPSKPPRTPSAGREPSQPRQGDPFRRAASLG